MLRLITKILQSYNIRVTSDTVRETLLVHPSYPTLSCVSDAFDIWKIKHTIAKLSLDKLQDLDVPVISYLSKNETIYITKVTKLHVFYRNSNYKLGKVKREQFEEKWDGISIIINDIDNAGERNYKEKKIEGIKNKAIKTILLSLLMLFIFSFIFLSWNGDSTQSFLSKIALTINNFIGGYICYLLYRQEKSHNTNFFDKFCKTGKFIDCNKVTKSTLSKLFGLISIAEIGIAYFSTIILWIFFAPLCEEWVILLWVFFLLSLPIIIWSVSVQLFYIKKICILCCLILLILSINIYFVEFSAFCNLKLQTIIAPTILLVILFLLITIIILYVNLNISNKCYYLQRKNSHIKFNNITLNAHLSTRKLETSNIGITWGDQRAKFEITMYVSLSCKYCNELLQELNWLLDVYPNFYYRLIFDIRADNHKDDNNMIISHFNSVFISQNREAFFKMLDLWYNLPSKNLEAFKMKTKILNLEYNQLFVKSMINFCENSQINYVPAILINGRLLSPIYDYKDFARLLQFLSTQ